MKNELTVVGRRFAMQQNVFMAAVVSLITLITYFIWGWLFAKSALVGGFIAIVPNVLFAYKAFKYAGAQASRKVVDSFFSGVKLKMALMALLLALAFKFLVLAPIPFFVMLSIVLLSPMITAQIFKH